MLNRNRQIGGEPVHVRDCYIWAEIYYLDSPTDYREYLPLASSQHELVMLDSSREGSNLSPLVGWTIPPALLFTVGLFLYLVLHVK
jgi:hypothetical protein